LKRLNALRKGEQNETVSSQDSFDSDMTDIDGVVKSKKKIKEL
jgi:hypothetical protein